jgi:hypothetical protein
MLERITGHALSSTCTPTRMPKHPYGPASSARRAALKSTAALGLTLALARSTLPLSSSSAGATDVLNSGAAGVRLDLRHDLVQGQERVSLARVRAQQMTDVASGAAAVAPRSGDPPDWGDYRLSLYDAETNALLFRAGFDSTLDRRQPSTATELSVVSPPVASRARLEVGKRRAGAVFQTLFSDTLDLRSNGSDHSPPPFTSTVESLLVSGAPDTKVDIAILGDGYVEAERDKFNADARRAAGYLLSVEPLKSRMSDFNVRAVFAPSRQSGITDPYLGVDRDTVLRCAYYAGGSERTLASRSNEAVREAASGVPYDFLLILANSRRYGGSAYFGGPAVVAIDSAAARYLVIHEFAHVIGGLADEYYIPTEYGPTYFGNIEPWQPNVTLSPGKGKWSHLVVDSAPSPTPWNKAEYERHFADYVRRYLRLRGTRAKEGVVERFMMDERERQAKLLAGSARRRHVGHYEGAYGYGRGVYRSGLDCIMFSLQTDYFCAACTAAIDRMIDWHCGAPRL